MKTGIIVILLIIILGGIAAFFMMKKKAGEDTMATVEMNPELGLSAVVNQEATQAKSDKITISTQAKADKMSRL